MCPLKGRKSQSRALQDTNEYDVTAFKDQNIEPLRLLLPSEYPTKEDAIQLVCDPAKDSDEQVALLNELHHQADKNELHSITELVLAWKLVLAHRILRSIRNT